VVNIPAPYCHIRILRPSILLEVPYFRSFCTDIFWNSFTYSSIHPPQSVYINGAVEITSLNNPIINHSLNEFDLVDRTEFSPKNLKLFRCSRNSVTEHVYYSPPTQKLALWFCANIFRSVHMPTSLSSNTVESQLSQLPINRITAAKECGLQSPVSELAHAVIVPVHSSLFQAVVAVTRIYV
jgi:hypothetical protein